ncbi:MAG: pirin family protein [Myxococcota bacterium]
MAERVHTAFDEGPLTELIRPKEKDLGGFFVRRAFPIVKRRHVGPAVFFDEMGPATFEGGAGVDVRPHPHVGLATITYLFEGAILHRDSLGTKQHITPGAINWMVAGKGIVHSERPAEPEYWTPNLHGLQLWVALPTEREEEEPSFLHVPAADVPERRARGVTLRSLVGRPFGMDGGAPGASPMGYADALFDAGGALEVPPEYDERALFVVRGGLRVESTAGVRELERGSLALLRPGETVTAFAGAKARAVYLAGEVHPEPRFLDWNFVSSRRERLEQAKADWRARAFPLVPGDERDRIPLVDG